MLLPQVVFNYGIAERVELVIDARHQLALGTPHLVDGMRLDRDRILDTDFLVKVILRKGSCRRPSTLPASPLLQESASPMEAGPLLPELAVAPVR